MNNQIGFGMTKEEIAQEEAEFAKRQAAQAQEQIAIATAVVAPIMDQYYRNERVKTIAQVFNTLHASPRPADKRDLASEVSDAISVVEMIESRIK